MFYTKFLDFEISNSGNSDGFVLLGNIKGNKMWGEGNHFHFGNYSNIEDVKKRAIILFMMSRMEIFSSQVANRAQRGRGCWGEFFLLRDVLKRENIEMPNEIKPSDCGNFMITFNKGEI